MQMKKQQLEGRGQKIGFLFGVVVRFFLHDKITLLQWFKRAILVVLLLVLFSLVINQLVKVLLVVFALGFILRLLGKNLPTRGSATEPLIRNDKVEWPTKPYEFVDGSEDVNRFGVFTGYINNPENLENPLYPHAEQLGWRSTDD